jgi:transcriptional regulator with XRE-family HTH domain
VGRKPKHPRDSYGAWLHHLRTELGLTQQALSDLTGIQQRTIAHWERTGRLAGRKEILTLAKAFKVSVSELLREKHQTGQVKSAQATLLKKDSKQKK